MSRATHATAMAKSDGSKPAIEPASARKSSAKPAITRSVRAIQAPMSGLRRSLRLSSPRRQLAHDTLALHVCHGCPACNLIERSAAPYAKPDAGFDRAHVDARGLDWPLHLRQGAESCPRVACRNVGSGRVHGNGLSGRLWIPRHCGWLPRVLPVSVAAVSVWRRPAGD